MAENKDKKIATKDEKNLKNPAEPQLNLKKSKFQKANEMIQSRLDKTIENRKTVGKISSDLKEGKNMYLRFNRTEKSSYDMTWVKRIEDAIPSIDEIIKNPKITTKTVTNVVPIELAKKTTSESIQHLATHSQYVKDIDKDGNVIPSKILNISAEDEIVTYENKFIATLIRKLVIFIEKRYEYILKYAPLRDYEVLYVRNHSIINGVDYEIESKVIAQRESETTNSEVNNEDFLRRVRFIRKYAYYFYTSPFMKSFKSEKNVKGNIIQTNIIRKNPRYHKCYELYKFMDKFDKLGVSFLVNEEFLEPSEEDQKNYQNAILSSMLTLNGNNAIHPIKKKIKTSAPKIMSTIDDDIFTFYPHEANPKFIRVDEEYINYKERNTKLLKVKPKKPERKYNIGNYLKKGKLKKEEERRKELLKRKKKEELEFLKEQKQLAIKEEKERIRLEQIAKKEEEMRRLNELEEIRKFIKEKALEDKAINEEIENERIKEELSKKEAENNVSSIDEAVINDENLNVNVDDNFDLEIEEETIEENEVKNDEDLDLSTDSEEALKEAITHINEVDDSEIVKELDEEEIYIDDEADENDTLEDEVTHIDYEALNENVDTNANSAPSLGEDLSNFEEKIDEKIKKIEEEIHIDDEADEKVDSEDEVAHIDYEALNEYVDANVDSAPSLDEDLSNSEEKIEEEIKKDE